MSEENVTQTTGSSATEQTTATETQTASQTSEAPSFFDSIPESYREKGYMKGVDSLDTLLSKLDNAEKLKGSKAYIPSDDAGDDIKAEFKNMLKEKGYLHSAPESYEFKEFEGVTLPEGVNEKVGDIFKNAGLSQAQAEKVRDGWIQHEIEMHNQRLEQADKEFETMAQKEWGDNWSESMADVTLHLKENLPQEYRDSLTNLPNSLLIPMIKAVSTALGTKEKPDGAPSQSSSANVDPSQVKEKFMQLRKQAMSGNPNDRKAFNDFQEHNRGAIAKAFGRA